MNNSRIGALVLAAAVLSGGFPPGSASAAAPTWVQVENGPAGGGDQADLVATDPATGTVRVVGTVAMVGDRNTALLVTAYSSGGARLSAALLDLPGGPDVGRPLGVALDPKSGTLYVVVARLDDPSVVLSVGPTGQLNWTRELAGAVGEYVEPSDVAVDAGTGSIYISATASDAVHAGSALTMGYTATGQPLWQRRTGDGTTAVTGLDVTVDPARGRVYTSGTAGGSYVAATTRGGQALWTTHVPEAYRFTATEVDWRSGRVFLLGAAAPEGAEDFLTAAVGPTGRRLWSQRADYGGNDVPVALGVDPVSGLVAVTGFSAGGTSSGDFRTVAYSGSGDRLWQARYDGPDGASDSPSGLVVDPLRGVVYVTGTSYAGPGADDPASVATLAYSRTGRQLRVDRYAEAGEVFGLALSVDPVRGRLAVTGNRYPVVGGLDDSDIITLSYPPAG